MEGAGRLPVVIRSLDVLSQRVYVSLRLRRDEETIARGLGISLEEARERAEKVRHALACAGQMDMLGDPCFVSLDEGGELHLRSGGMDPQRSAMLAEFKAHVRGAVAELPEEQALLLRLRFGYGLTSAQIVEFCRRVGRNPVPARDIHQLKEQDVYAALDAAMKSVLARLKAHYGDGGICGIKGLRYVFEEIGV